MMKMGLLVLLVALAGCASSPKSKTLQPKSLTQLEAQQVDSLLGVLYRSFSYDDGGEPDWQSMRSVFVDGAQFVTESAVDKAPKPQTIDEFISSWQASMRNKTSQTVATEEWVSNTKIEKVGRLFRVDVEFYAKKRGDPTLRKPGLDSLILIKVGDAWKILSFVIHYESKL